MPALPDLATLAASIDDVLGVVPAPTTIVRARTDAIARFGLALDAGPAIAAWAHAQALDAVLLHRHWALQPERWPPAIGLLANHDAFDRRLGFGRSPELAAALALTLGDAPSDTLGLRDGFPLGTIGSGAPRTLVELRATLHATFGGIAEELLPDGATSRRIVRIAMARAMTPATVAAAVAAGADAYVTGQLRAPAREAAERARLPVLAVGHRASERWAMRTLAAWLRAAWPMLHVHEAPDDEDAARLTSAAAAR